MLTETVATPDTVWLLAVDGVINSDRPGWGDSPRQHHVYSLCDGVTYRMRWAPALLDRIRLVHWGGQVEIRWCSTWCPEIDQLEKLWALPPFGRALTCTPVPKGSAGDALKVEAARAVLAGGRRLIWTDDTAVPVMGPLHRELTSRGRGLLIRPSPCRGLQPYDMDTIDAFVREGVADELTRLGQDLASGGA